MIMGDINVNRANISMNFEVNITAYVRAWLQKIRL